MADWLLDVRSLTRTLLVKLQHILAVRSQHQSVLLLTSLQDTLTVLLAILLLSLATRNVLEPVRHTSLPAGCAGRLTTTDRCPRPCSFSLGAVSAAGPSQTKR